MKECLVSVLVPSYNHEKYILDCLESIKNQSYKNIELVICDDNSSDNTYVIALEWCKKNASVFHNYFIINNEENTGIAKNCNKMIKMCSGEYIKIIASDDILLSSSISEMVLCGEENKEYDILYSNGYYIPEETKYYNLNISSYRTIYKDNYKNPKKMFDELYKRDFIAAPTVLYRKATFEKLGLFSEKYIFEDWEYYLRTAKLGKIGYLNKKTVGYREAQNSLSRFTNTNEGRVKYRKFTSEQRRLLNSYAEYTSISISYFLDMVIGGAMRIHDDEYIREILNSGEYKMRISRLIKLLVYKTFLYEKFFN